MLKIPMFLSQPSPPPQSLGPGHSAPPLGSLLGSTAKMSSRWDSHSVTNTDILLVGAGPHLASGAPLRPTQGAERVHLQIKSQAPLFLAL